MKKILSLALFLILFFNIPCSTNFKASAASYDQIVVNQEWRASWDGNNKYVYLTVDQTGYYDLSITDYEGEGDTCFELDDMNSNDYGTWYNTSIYFDDYIDGTYNQEHIYLIEDHLYQIILSYGDYIEDEYIEYDADIGITFTKTTYEPAELTLGSSKNVVVGYETYEWLEFTTTTAGEYVLTLNDYAYSGLVICEKVAGNSVDFMDLDEINTKRFYLKANTEYIIIVYGYEDSNRLVSLNLSKASKEITIIVNKKEEEIVLDKVYEYGSTIEDVVPATSTYGEFKVYDEDRETITIKLSDYNYMNFLNMLNNQDIVLNG